MLTNTLFGSYYTGQQGSGFVTTVNGQQLIVTNNHVVAGAINYTVTFSSGDSYSAKVLGSDARADLAVLSVSGMPSNITPLTLASARTLQVGDPVVAVGSPYGLSGTLTTGVISALGRSITEDNSQTIADIIQTSTAINPGNSGGPLITYTGQVVGITTAGISDSQGLGFAIPSDTIMRELPSLVSSGSYSQHPSINAKGEDMTYALAQSLHTSTTYGVHIQTASGSSGLKSGDVITAVGDQRITNVDDLLSYLELNTHPGQSVDFTVVRGGQQQTVQVTVGTA